MGLGVLESKYSQDVPGTARLEDLDSQGNITVAQDHANLKRTREGIILIPQPSDDPNDPLNWPLWRRDVITFLLCLLSILASTLSPLLAANTITLLTWFSGESITNMALLTGYQLAGVGVAGFIWVATARVWGKRHTFILGTIIIIASSVWGGLVGKNYSSLVAARFFQGVGLAPFEACVNAAVGDMYCVHQRGKRMALSNVCLFGGAFFTPVIVGVITETQGWQWTFFYVAIFTAITLPFVYFFCPETTYIRHGKHSFKHELGDMSAASRSSGQTDDHRSFSQSVTALGKRDSDIKQLGTVSQVTLDLKETRSTSLDIETQRHIEPVPWVSKKSLKLFNGRFTNESFFKLLLRPLPLFCHPGILWACLIQGTLIGWTALLGVILALVMIQPPLFFDARHTGYMYGGAFVGALVGFVISGVFSDWTTKLLCKRNKGIFEPEFRLVLVIPQLLFGCIGLYGFGYASANTATYGWLLSDVFFGFVVCGMVLGAVASALYIVDAHSDIEVEGFTCLLIFKNMFTFALTFKAFDWYLEAGIYKMMYSTASLQIAVLCLTIPMYIFGKRNRAFFSRHDILRICHLR